MIRGFSNDTLWHERIIMAITLVVYLNGSKSGSLHGLEGSNPSLSAMEVLKIADVERFSALSLLLDFRHLHASFMQKRGVFLCFFGKT